MPSIGEEDSFRVLVERRRGCVPPLSPFVGAEGCRTFTYQKLPQQLLKLTILKLDGSCFDVQVARTATVAELKLAVEDVFTLSPKDCQGKISWSHVWGHFCLCFEGQKLLNDKACIRSFGINDGDQLHFVRHLSINHNPMKRRSKSQRVAWEQQVMSSSGSDFQEDREHNIEDDGAGDDQEESLEHFYFEDKDENFIGHPEFKLAHFLRGWLSYSGLWSSGRMRSEAKVRPSRFSRCRLRSGTGMIRL